MKTPIRIPADQIVFNEVIPTAVKIVRIQNVTIPQIQIPSPTVPVSIPKISTSVKGGITTNQILVGIQIGAVLCGVAYYKRRQEELERSSYF